MKKSLSTQEIVECYDILQKAKMTKMSAAEKYALLRANNVLKPIATAFHDFTNDATERLKPANWNEIEQMSQNFGNLSTEDKIIVNIAYARLNAEVEKCTKPELEKVVEVELTTLNEEAFGHLLEANEDWEIKTAQSVQTVVAE